MKVSECKSVSVSEIESVCVDSTPINNIKWAGQMLHSRPMINTEIQHYYTDLSSLHLAIFRSCIEFRMRLSGDVSIKFSVSLYNDT